MAGGRPIGKRHQEDVRKKIQVSQIINRFHDAFKGKVELTQVQVNCGKTLLDKALPDLRTTEVTGEIEHYHEHTIGFEDSISELLNSIRK